jgi:DNA-binding protein HU-beta
MNKAELITAVAEKAGLTKKDTGLAIEIALNVITEELVKGESISLIGFGTFSTSERASRQGVNPSTGEKLQIAASTVAKFKVGAKLKDAVKQSKI